MTQPTKADLAAAVAKLTEENAGLRDLLAAASECAGTVPVSADCNWVAEWRRSTTVLSKIKVLCNLDGGWQGEAAYGARVLRECAAEPVAYEVLAEPVPVISDGEPWTRAGVAAAIVPAPPVPNPPYHMTPGTIGPCCLAEDGGYICNAQDGHDGPQHVAYGSDGGECHRWPVVPAPSGMQDPAPVARLLGDGDCWLPLAAGACGDGITGDGEGIACGVPSGHLRRHEREALPAMGGGTCHWPNLADPETGTEPQHAPVITDSGRTCPESHPGSGAPCYRDGDHGVHRDPDGEEWRTDGAQEHGYVTPAMAERRDKAAAEYEARQQAASVTA